MLMGYIRVRNLGVRILQHQAYVPTSLPSIATFVIGKLKKNSLNSGLLHIN